MAPRRAAHIHRIIVHGDEINNMYKPGVGVYSSGDEAFVTAQIFKDNELFTDILVLCGPEQAARWELHAIANGIAPRIEPIMPPSGQSFHAAIGRTEQAMIAYTRHVDPDWQAGHSFMANTSRLLRKPPKS